MERVSETDRGGLREADRRATLKRELSVRGARPTPDSLWSCCFSACAPLLCWRLACFPHERWGLWAPLSAPFSAEVVFREKCLLLQRLGTNPPPRQGPGASGPLEAGSPVPAQQGLLTPGQANPPAFPSPPSLCPPCLQSPSRLLLLQKAH